jgi:hypothetical protein
MEDIDIEVEQLKGNIRLLDCFSEVKDNPKEDDSKMQ